jgi:hypothetical protein
MDRVHAFGEGNFKKAVEFLNQIIHCYGILNNIITDFGTPFTSTTFWDFCDDRGVVVNYVSVVHPKANGQVERAQQYDSRLPKKEIIQGKRQGTRKVDKRIASCGLGSQNTV